MAKHKAKKAPMYKKKPMVEVEIEIGKHKKKESPKKPKKSMLKKKMHKVMDEFSEGKLHSGSKHGPEVTNPKQAVAIAYSEARKAEKKKK